MSTICASLVAIFSFFLLCKDFIMSLSNDKHVGIIDAFNTTSDIWMIFYIYIFLTIWYKKNIPCSASK